MSLRHLLTLLPALLAPLGALGEVPVAETQGGGVTPAAEWEVGALPGAPDWRTSDTSSGGSGDPAQPDGDLASGSLGPPGQAQAGCAPFGVSNRAHLQRCGHDARRLNLPPPLRD